jgi:hypothetical protein
VARGKWGARQTEDPSGGGQTSNFDAAKITKELVQNLYVAKVTITPPTNTNTNNNKRNMR